MVKALASATVGKGSIPGQGTRFHMLWVTTNWKRSYGSKRIKDFFKVTELRMDWSGILALVLETPHS